MAQSKKSTSQDTTMDDQTDQTGQAADNQPPSPPGESDAEATSRTVIRSAEGPRVVALDRKNENGTYCYLFVEMLGDMDLFPRVDVKPASGRDDLMELCIDGRWVWSSIESGPLTVPDFVE